MDPHRRSAAARSPAILNHARRLAVVVSFGLLTSLAIAASACGSSGSPAKEPMSSDATTTGGASGSPATEAKTSGVTTAAGATADTVVVEATEFKFAPAAVKIPVGKPVRVVLENKGAIEHEILIRDLSVKILATQTPHEMHSSGEAGMKAMSEHVEAGRFHVHAGSGEEAAETLQADAPGTYEFACEIPGHKEAGMVGRIEVQQ